MVSKIIVVIKVAIYKNEFYLTIANVYLYKYYQCVFYIISILLDNNHNFLF